MKKSFATICALLSLAACNKVTPIEENPTQKESGQEFKVNLTFSRSNISEDTKASVKTSFASGDVVFIFFNGVGNAEHAKYLEMKYNGSTCTWDPEQKNTLGASDLSGAGTKELTAIYLPYGSGYEVAYDGGFTIKDDSGNDYSGHFYAHHVGYTFTSNTLGADVNLSAVTSVGDKLVHFDVTDFVDGHTYAMYQEYIKPISLSSISAEGIVNKNVGSKGDAIQGYQDASFISFSGVLDNTVVGSPVDYWFSIRDTFDGTLYYRDAGSQTISANKYIGLGSFASKWSIATPGQFTVNAGGDKVTFAPSNLSYRGSFEDPDKKWQLMKYPWTVVGIDGAVHDATSELGYYSWGTSGWDNTENDPYWTKFHPWDIARWSDHVDDNNIYGLGPTSTSSENIKHLTGDNSWGDWGVYNTSAGRHIYYFGGDIALEGSWRTPSRLDFIYLFGRSNNNNDDPYHPRYRKYGRVVLYDGENTINGVVLIPDQSWVDPQSTTWVGKPNRYFNNNDNGTYGGDLSIVGEDGMESSQATNYYTMVNWNKMEAAGAVFLPAAGFLNPYTVDRLNEQVSLWSTTSSSAYTSKSAALTIGIAHTDGTDSIPYLCSAAERRVVVPVRLIHDL